MASSSAELPCHLSLKEHARKAVFDDHQWQDSRLTFRSHFILVKILSDSRHGSLFPDLALLVIFLSASGGITPSPRAAPSYWRRNIATAPATTLFSNALKSWARSSASIRE